MGLSASLQVGRSGLLSSQTALQVTGNNLANLATPGYHRNKVTLSPTQAYEINSGQFLGTGVQVQQISRVINEALEARLRGSVSDHAASSQRQELLTQIEAIEGGLTEQGLASRLGEFFNRWSEVASNPQDLSLRTLLVEEAGTLTAFIKDQRQELGNLQRQTDNATGNAVSAMNHLLDQVATLNQKIALQQGSKGSGAGPLRDQRDLLVTELAEYAAISTVEQPGGTLDVFVGSTPLVLGTQSRGVELQRTVEDGQTGIQVIVRADGEPLRAGSGRIGALVDFRYGDLQQAIEDLDALAGALIYETNRIHAQGQGLEAYSSVTGLTRVADASVSLADPQAGLAFLPQHGSFKLAVTEVSTGQRVTKTVAIDLDGVDPTLDTSLSSLAAQLSSIPHVTAEVTADGRLAIRTDSPDYRISFSDDTSGVLAALGVNTFFSGSRASDIGLSETVMRDGRFVAVSGNHLPGDNSNALAILGLRDQPVEQLGGHSIIRAWNRHVEDFAIRLAQSRSQNESDAVIRDNLAAQQQAYSGVNADQEIIDLLQFQRAYQASARFISVVDEMMQTLMGMV